MLNKYIIGSIVWALIILIFTLTPGNSVPDLDVFSYDKFGHGFVFFVLSFLLISGFYQAFTASVNRKKALFIGVIISALYGFAIEAAQSVIPHRSMELYDALANIIGSFLGLGLFYLHNKFKTRA